MMIWHWSNKEWTRLILWRSEKKLFRVTQQGEFMPLLTNMNYILIDKKFVPVLEKVREHCFYDPVKIIDYTTGVETENYLELKIENYVDLSNIDKLNSSGLNIWSYGEYVFITEEVKRGLIKIDGQSFEFTPGFSHFAG